MERSPKARPEHPCWRGGEGPPESTGRGLNVELLVEGWGDLNQDAASGGEGVTWQASAAHRQTKVAALVERLKQKRYRATLIRRHYLPQGNGQGRP